MKLVARALRAVPVAVAEIGQRDAGTPEAPFDALPDDLAELVGIDLRNQRLRGVHYLLGKALAAEEGVDGGHVFGRVAGDEQRQGVAGAPQIGFVRETVIQHGHHHRQQLHPFADAGGIDVPADHHGLGLPAGGRDVEEQQQRGVGNIFPEGGDVAEAEYRGVALLGEVTVRIVTHAVVGQETVGLARAEMRQVPQGLLRGVQAVLPALHQGEVGEALLRRVGDQVEADAVREAPALDLAGYAQGRQFLPGQHKRGQDEHQARYVFSYLPHNFCKSKKENDYICDRAYEKLTQNYSYYEKIDRYYRSSRGCSRCRLRPGSGRSDRNVQRRCGGCLRR